MGVKRKSLIFLCFLLGVVFLTGLPAARQVVSQGKRVNKNVIQKRDGRFVAYDNGIIHDTKTGLEWFVGPDENITLDEANNWIQALSFDGGRWRMPTMAELKGLYKYRAGTRNISPLFKFTGWWVWSKEANNLSSGWCFLFNSDCGHRCHGNLSGGRRVFAVRSVTRVQS